MKRTLRKLTLSRDTLHRLEAKKLEAAVGGATTTCNTFCACETDLCITLKFSNCNTCNCA
jgi:hypothetical protein